MVRYLCLIYTPRQRLFHKILLYFWEYKNKITLFLCLLKKCIEIVFIVHKVRSFHLQM